MHAPRLDAQRGAALMLLVVLLGMGALAAFVAEMNRRGQKLERENISRAALAQARQALIARAVTDDNRPGSLPCPDGDDDGVADNCASYLGRLPWKTLRLGDLRDGYGERLWYELSANYRDSNAVEPLNPVATVGTLDGGGVAAKIYAPGPALGGQSREAGNALNPANYLEGGNDLTLGISDRDIFTVVRRRIAGEIRFRLNDAAYPETMPVPAMPLRFVANWAGVTTYIKISSNEAQVVFSDCPGLIFSMKWNALSEQSDLSWLGEC